MVAPGRGWTTATMVSPPALVREAHHGVSKDVIIFCDNAFYLGGVDLFAAGDDEVFKVVHDIEVAVLVLISQIAGVEPACGIRLLRHLKGCPNNLWPRWVRAPTAHR